MLSNALPNAWFEHFKKQFQKSMLNIKHEAQTKCLKRRSPDEICRKQQNSFGLQCLFYQVWASTICASVLGFHISVIKSGLHCFMVSPFHISNLGFNISLLAFLVFISGLEILVLDFWISYHLLLFKFGLQSPQSKCFEKRGKAFLT